MKHIVKLTWWWALPLLIIIPCVFLCSAESIQKIENLIKLWGDAIVPIVMIAGVVLGYSVFQRKLKEEYIQKQFDIIHTTNREIRQKCLLLKSKYPYKAGHTPLTLSYIEELYNEICSLHEITIDGNSCAFRYVELIKDAIFHYIESLKRHIVNNSIADDKHGNTYLVDKEIIDQWFHIHLSNVFTYARTLGILPSDKEIEKRYVNGDVASYLTDNSYKEVESDPIVKVSPSSQILYKFFVANSLFLQKDTLLLQACFIAAPTIQPLARMLYQENIYIPLAIKGKDESVFETTMYLVACHKEEHTDLRSIHYEYECLYVNFGFIDFVSGMKDISALREFYDGYLNSSLNMEQFHDFNKFGQAVRVLIHEDEAKANYKRLHKQFAKKLKSEMK